MIPTDNAPLEQSPSALQELVGRFQSCPDFRIDYGNKHHPLVDILVIAICSVVGGANSWLAVERFAHSHEAWFRTFLTMPNGVPSHDTFRRVFLLLDPKELSSRFSSWVGDISGRLPSRHIAIDGKTMRGSDDTGRGLQALHMVHAFATDHGVCLAQQATAEKSNEITAIPELLKLLDLKGAMVTIDAMGCQKSIAQDIVTRGGDYVLAVKGNQENLHEDIRAAMQPIVDSAGTGDRPDYARTEEMNRGRSERRTCYTSDDLGGIRDKGLWKKLKTIGVIVSERVVGGKREFEERYFISSRALSAGEMLGFVRDHWKVENQLHWILDVVFGEDSHQLQTGHGPANFTTLRKLAHALIKNSNPKHGIKGTREMAGWDINTLERILHDAAISLENHNA